MTELTVDRLREILHYDPLNGVFTWRVKLSARQYVGDEAGCRNANTGSVTIKISRTTFKASRLAHLYMTGEWPPHKVTQWDRDSGNNRWANLRVSKTGELTQELLRMLLTYDPETGVFRHLVGNQKVKPGDVAGYIHSESGYWHIKLAGKSYQASRLAVLYMTGAWPTDLVDHKKPGREHRHDNKWGNLRHATNKQNMENRAQRAHIGSGVSGVTWNQTKQRWIARIGHNLKRKHLGDFGSLIDAVAARYRAERELYTHSQNKE